MIYIIFTCIYNKINRANAIYVFDSHTSCFRYVCSPSSFLSSPSKNETSQQPSTFCQRVKITPRTKQTSPPKPSALRPRKPSDGSKFEKIQVTVKAFHTQRSRTPSHTLPGPGIYISPYAIDLPNSIGRF
jgi:hypothetical protein